MSEAPEPRPIEEHIKEAHKKEGRVFEALQNAGDNQQFSFLHSKLGNFNQSTRER